MKKATVKTLQDHKRAGERFSVLAAYDATFARLIEAAGIEVILVGDSLGMVLQGHDSTLPVGIEDMVYHTKCVSRASERALIIGDMPFGSYNNLEQTLTNAVKLMQAGAHMIKLEGCQWLLESIQALVERGIPVCSHLGLTPQSVNTLGGFKVQGKDPEKASIMLEEAKQIQEAGASLLVLECVPSELAAQITQILDIPVIGIGAGPGTDAQVLVLHDMLGLSSHTPKFVRNFLDGNSSVQNALKAFNNKVLDGSFPSGEHCF